MRAFGTLLVAFIVTTMLACGPALAARDRTPQARTASFTLEDLHESEPFVIVRGAAHSIVLPVFTRARSIRFRFIIHVPPPVVGTMRVVVDSGGVVLAQQRARPQMALEGTLSLAGWPSGVPARLRVRSEVLAAHDCLGLGPLTDAMILDPRSRFDVEVVRAARPSFTTWVENYGNTTNLVVDASFARDGLPLPELAYQLARGQRWRTNRTRLADRAVAGERNLVIAPSATPVAYHGSTVFLAPEAVPAFLETLREASFNPASRLTAQSPGHLSLAQAQIPTQHSDDAGAVSFVVPASVFGGIPANLALDVHLSHGTFAGNEAFAAVAYVNGAVAGSHVLRSQASEEDFALPVERTMLANVNTFSVALAPIHAAHGCRPTPPGRFDLWGDSTFSWTRASAPNALSIDDFFRYAHGTVAIGTSPGLERYGLDVAALFGSAGAVLDRIVTFRSDRDTPPRDVSAIAIVSDTGVSGARDVRPPGRFRDAFSMIRTTQIAGVPALVATFSGSSSALDVPLSSLDALHARAARDTAIFGAPAQ